MWGCIFFLFCFMFLRPCFYSLSVLCQANVLIYWIPKAELFQCAGNNNNKMYAVTEENINSLCDSLHKISLSVLKVSSSFITCSSWFFTNCVVLFWFSGIFFWAWIFYFYMGFDFFLILLNIIPSKEELERKAILTSLAKSHSHLAI